MKNKFLATILVCVLVINQAFGVNAMGKTETTSNKEMSISEVADSVEKIAEAFDVEIDEQEKKISLKKGIAEMEFEQKPIEVEVIEEEGITYYIETYYQDGKRYVKTYSDKMDDVSIISVDDSNVEINMYELNNSETGYNKLNIEVENSETSTDKNTVIAQAIRYNSKVKCSIGDYYYQTGSNGKKTYLKIGCSANYRIRTDNLSSKKNSNCNAYKNAIKNCKSYHAKGNVLIAGTGITAGAIYTIIATSIVKPEALIIALVGAALGGNVLQSAIENFIDAYREYLDVCDYYSTIKTYGTKL